MLEGASHYLDYSCLECDAIEFGTLVPIFCGNLLSPPLEFLQKVGTTHLPNYIVSHEDHNLHIHA